MRILASSRGDLRAGHHHAGRKRKSIFARSKECCAGSNKRGRTRGHSRSWLSNWSTTKTRCDCLLAIKFLVLAGPSAKEAIPALDRKRKDPNAEVRKQVQAASERIKSKAKSSQDNGNARKTASS
jgi:hypothetical protein